MTITSHAYKSKTNLSLAYWFSGALAVAVFIAAAVSVFMPGIFRDPPLPAGNARGTAAVIMLIAVPMLLVAMFLTARGSQRAHLIWLGTLGYIFYNSAIFSFAIAFNPLFLLYVASLSLSFWAIVAFIVQSNVEELSSKFNPVLPVKAFSTYIIMITLAFYSMWLKQIIPALFTSGSPAFLEGTNMLTSPIHVLDLGFALPLSLIIAIWLWQRKPWGYFLSGVMLTMLVIETISIAVDQVFGYLNDPALSLAAVPVFVVLTLIGLLVAAAYLRYLRPEPVSIK